MDKFEAKYYRKINGQVQCFLCPHNCKISDGKYGICNVRKNENGKLIAKVFGRVIARHTDPIEKKPLYHFYPGKNIVSIGTVGCNLKCFFCQNCEISQVGAKNFGHISYTSPDSMLGSIIGERDNIGIAYTYNEPSINFEYITEVARRVRENDLRNVMVSNGYISPEPLKELIKVIDAFNIDLKAFSESFYKKYTHSDLQNVKNSLIQIADSSSHLEVTFLVIPGLNDSDEEFQEMINWLSSNFGRGLVLHISRYFPHYKSDIPPTPVSTLRKFHTMASEKLDFVYLGNVSDLDARNTHCPECNELVIERGFRLQTNLNEKGQCDNCRAEILNYY